MWVHVEVGPDVGRVIRGRLLLGQRAAGVAALAAHRRRRRGAALLSPRPRATLLATRRLRRRLGVALGVALGQHRLVLCQLSGGEPEVSQLEIVSEVDEDVLGLEVAVGDSLGVHVLQASQQLSQEAEGVGTGMSCT